MKTNALTIIDEYADWKEEDITLMKQSLKCYHLHNVVDLSPYLQHCVDCGKDIQY